MAKVEKGLFYTEDHDWFKKDGDVYLMGLADYAQDSLGDIVYVELPEVGDEIDADESIASVESVKAASDVITPFAAEVVEVNEELEDEPAKLNADPYGTWIAKLKIADFDESKLLDDAKYEEQLGDE